VAHRVHPTEAARAGHPSVPRILARVNGHRWGLPINSPRRSGSGHPRIRQGATGYLAGCRSRRYPAVVAARWRRWAQSSCGGGHLPLLCDEPLISLDLHHQPVGGDRRSSGRAINTAMSLRCARCEPHPRDGGSGIYLAGAFRVEPRRGAAEAGSLLYDAVESCGEGASSR
jgi:hypothetical protein